MTPHISAAPSVFPSAMQDPENGEGEGAATAEVQVNEQPNALIACKVPEEVFNARHLKVSCCSVSSISCTDPPLKPNPCNPLLQTA